uniref:BMP-binding endothelial regulator protein n=2 Tax=Cacopsylla melanoneura TaxID=428564 RepID=A0A8D8YRF6_9HEMI
MANLIHLTFVSLLLHSLPSTFYAIERGIMGMRQTCTNEGEEVNVEQIFNIKCFICICKNGFVECNRKSCPNQEGCHKLLEAKEKDGCCRKCQGCVHFGIFRESGSEWTDPDNPCRIFTCKAGVVTESEMQCYAPCKHPTPPGSGQCCPTCPGCRFVSGRNATLVEDSCLKCQCARGHLTCVKRACPVLACPTTFMEWRPGQCCPQCTGQRNIMEKADNSILSSSCTLGQEFHYSGQKFQLDRCTKCSCHNATSVCHRETCPVLDCPPDQVIPGGPKKCCSTCPTDVELPKYCTSNGKIYQDGESWSVDPCKSCICHKGQPRCSVEVCPSMNTPCPPHMKLVKLPGACCAQCIESDGVCTVFGDPHYRTFDGKFYSFQGSCKYQLTADCTGGAFSIRVTNDARDTKTSSWTKTVSIRIGDMKVNLGEKLRVKIDGQRVSLPYDMPSKVVVTKTAESVLVETAIGIKVLWDGRSFLEVSAPSKFKNRLCGLCGNFNGISTDDLTTKRGRVITDANKFGASWRVGGKKACSRSSIEPATPGVRCSHHPSQRKYRDKKCKPLRSDVFAPCHGRLNHLMYFKSCLVDMCECPAKTCHCESFTAYARECSRLGVQLGDWRKLTGCHPGAPPR